MSRHAGTPCCFCSRIAFYFLLRTPSEALPVRVGRDGGGLDSNAFLFKEGDQLVLTLRRRKTRHMGAGWSGSAPATRARKHVCITKSGR